MDKKSSDIVKSFKKTVISDELSKISGNTTEIVIDAILDNEPLKGIPLIGFTLGLFKIGKTVAARHQVKKLWKFLFQLNEVSQADRIKFMEKIEKDNKSKNELFERTLFILGKLDDESKAEIIGRLFNNLALEKVKPANYLRLSLIIDKTYSTDLLYLDIGYNVLCKIPDEEQHKFYTENDIDYINDSLVTAGLLTKEIVEDKARKKVMGDGKITYLTKFEPTDIGEILIEFGF